MRNETKSLLFVCTAIAVFAALTALSSCSVVADTSALNLNEDSAPKITGFNFLADTNDLSEDAIGIIDTSDNTISVIVPYGTERSGLIPSIIWSGNKIEPEDASARDFTETLSWTVKSRAGAEAVYRVTVVSAPPLSTLFIYNTSAIYNGDDLKLIGSRANLASKSESTSDRTIVKREDEPKPNYDPSLDEIVSLGDLPDWAANSMTADSRLALLCGLNYAFTINEVEYQKDYIYKIIWGKDVEGATTLGDDFLAEFFGLASLEFPPLSNITSIGDGFLAGCNNLALIDLSPLSKITRIGEGFMRDCRSLPSLDLVALSNVTSIGGNFLTSSRIVSLDLSPLSKLRSIGESFLYSCSNLTTLDFSPLSSITSIDYIFLGACSSLSSVNMGAISVTVFTGYEYSFNSYDDEQVCKVKVAGSTSAWVKSFFSASPGVTFVNSL
ncbi:MAG: leucine-rich repeat domain-containing protein [Spirochaetaceae bacterium]|jgi:hypothetical protein|nr:leucine-rich repeat domain-containing protein [Spirochaetaceae bacterium]